MIPWSTSVAIRTAPFVTWALIAANGALFLYELALPPRALEAFLMEWAVVPARYAHPAWAARIGLESGNLLPFLSSMFLHGGWGHILLNMWTLLIFGPAVEDRFGAGRYLLFYLACGVGAAVAHALVNADSTVPSLGASGAIAGVMGAFMRLFPLSRVVVMIPVIIIPFFFELHAFFYVGFWMAIQLVQGLTDLLSPVSLGGIAWWAHIGGFAVGFLATGRLRRRSRPPQRDEGVWGFLPDGRRRHPPRGYGHGYGRSYGPWGRRWRRGPWG
jgi:membrane associated rhomboid family serine protease